MKTEKVNVALNWSSGKDAALAYHILLQNEHYHVKQLLTTVNEDSERIVMHGVREELLDMQADAMQLPLKKIYLPASPKDNLYKQAMQQALTEFAKQGITVSAFGDIFLEDLKLYREEQLAQACFTGLFPLWKKDTRELIQLVEHSGIEAMIVCVNEKFLSKEFLGRKIERPS